LAQALLAILTSAHGAPAYALIFGVLLACGVGLPLPEDVALVTGGYLSFIGAVDFPLVLLVAFAGILSGDYLIFAAGRRYGNEIAGTRWIHRFITDEKRIRCEAYFAAHGQGLVFAARFLPGLRAVTYFVAGASPFSRWRFLVCDALAACISVPVWLVLGRRLGQHLPQLLVWVERVHMALLVGGAAALLGLLIAVKRRILLRSTARAGREALEELADLSGVRGETLEELADLSGVSPSSD
jgi:membrane protein DedA with SNARE-associated domain